LTLGFLEDRSLPSFLGPVDYPAGSSPAATASALFNNDTIPDLVVANNGSNTVSVLLGNGDGSFQAAMNSTAGANPNSVAVGDFNGDGKMDVATTNGGDFTVSVLIGIGNGTFQAPVSTSLGDSPTAIAEGDLNADGKMDLVATSNTFYPGSWGYYGYYPGWTVGHASVMLGTGTGSFGAPITTWLGYGYHSGAAVEDFNGDGRDDLAAADYENGTVGVALADASGTLQGATYFSAGYYSGAVAAGDVNGDNKADVVTANWYGENVSVLLGDGLGGFATAQTYAAGGSAVAVVLGDFNGHNGDGKLDIAVSTGSGSGVSVLLGRGNGTFVAPMPSSSDSYLSGVAAGDFNGDGWLDAVAANSSGNSASVFVNDHTWPPLDAPSLSISDVTVTEGNSGTVTALFTVSLSAAYGQPVTVHYATADGSATVADGDYLAASGTLTFAPGDTSKTIPVTVNGDHLAEWDESFSVHLSASTNAFVSDPLGWGTIQDDEPTVSIVNYVSGDEGNIGTTAFNFAVTLSAATDASVSVPWATRDLTADEQYWYGPGATAGVDYQANSGTLTFDAGETTKMITVLVNGDWDGESDELFWVGLENSTTARLGNSQAFGSIVNDERFIYISNAGSVVEGNSGTTPMTFTVSLSGPSSSPVTVDFSTADGSATVAGGDYQATSGTLTFDAGQTVKTIVVPIKGDRLAEDDEYLNVNLSGATGAAIASGTGFGTILDDEPRIRISDVTVTEGNTGTVNASFTVSLSAASDVTVTVHYATANDSAGTGDYTAASGDVTFLAGQVSKTIPISVTGDRIAEPTETFTVNLSAAVNGFISDGQGVGSILDNEPRISINNVTKKEGNGGTTQFSFTVSLSAAYDQPVTVNYATANGTATAGSDYQAKSGTLTFAAGVRSMTLTINVLTDKVKEANETFFVNLSGASSNAAISNPQGIGTILDDDNHGKR
jgi:hypothetical protein